ncbi:MAG: hypothetical protein ACRENE_00890 [Polyangiaceae bacterium]
MNATAEIVERVRHLDGELRRRNVPVRPWVAARGPSQGEALWDPGCVERVASTLGTDSHALAELLQPTAQ